MRIRLILPVAAALVAGCGEEKKVAVHPVKGQVFYDGKPAAGVQVFLSPTSAPTVPKIPSNPHGKTDANGEFTLTTFAEGDGAAEGGYQVVFHWPPEVKEDEEGADSDKLLGWYNGVNSKLSVQIKPGENTLGPFKLPATTKPPGESVGVPGKN